MKSPTGYVLKIVAIVGMTCNHAAHAFLPLLPAPLAVALYSLGGVTFPVMAFLLVEGYSHTSNLKKYAARLLLFALVSQIPYSLLWGAEGNVLLTLLASLGALWAKDNVRNALLKAAAIIALVGTTYPCDWGVVGPILVILFSIERNGGAKGVLAALAPAYAAVLLPAVSFFLAPETTGTAMSAGLAAEMASTTYQGELGYALIGFSLAAALIISYSGERGRPLKWFFYGYYPAHLLVIWAATAFIL